MNNPGIDLETWERLRKQWAGLQSAGHTLGIEFRLIADPKDENKILAIDVVQKIDGDFVTETVQHTAGEAYAALGIAGAPMETLVEAYKRILRNLQTQSVEVTAPDLVITMSPVSVASGEIKGYAGKENSDVRSSLPLNYRHYYVLNALREKMLALTGDGWNSVRTVYRSGELEFYFEY